MTEITLEFLARQNERILRELDSMRDDLQVTTARMQRVDHMLIEMLSLVRAIDATLHLMASPANARELEAAIAEIEAGRVVERDDF